MTIKKQDRRCLNTSTQSLDNALESIDEKSKPRKKKGTIVSSVSQGDVLFVICKLRNGNIAGHLYGVDDVVPAEVMIPCYLPFKSMNVDEGDVIGKEVEILFLGRTPVHAVIVANIDGSNSPFAIPRSTLIAARNQSEDHTLTGRAIEFLEALGYTEEEIDSVVGIKLDDMNYEGVSFTTGRVGWQTTHEKDLKNKKLLPKKMIDNMPGNKGLAAVKKRNCFLPPILFNGR